MIGCGQPATRQALVLGCVLGLTANSAIAAADDSLSEASREELIATIRALKERVAQTEQQNRDIAARLADIESALTGLEPPDPFLESDAVVASSGASENTALAPNAGYNGPALLGAAGNGFFIGSDDGEFKLTAGGYLQNRYTYNYRQEDASGEGGSDAGFTTPRARLWLGGKASDKWSYFVRGDFRGVASQSVGETDPVFATVGGRFQMDAYFLSYGGPFDRFSMKVGQFPSNLHREQFTEPHAKTTQDNSPLATVFDTAVFQGVEVNWNPGRWRNTWVVSNGQRAVNRSFNDPRTAEIALSQRTEYILAGDPVPAWVQLYNFTGRPGDPFVAKVGGSLHWEEGRESAPDVEFDVLQAGVDLNLEGNGWYAFARGDYWNTTWRSPGNSADDWGVGVQGGFYVAPDLEVYGRFDAVIPDNDREDNGEFKTLTVGFNYFPISGPGFENIKTGIEASYYFDPVSGSLVAPSNSLGLLPSTRGDQFVISAEVGLLW